MIKRAFGAKIKDWVAEVKDAGIETLGEVAKGARDKIHALLKEHKPFGPLTTVIGVKERILFHKERAIEETAANVAMGGDPKDVIAPGAGHSPLIQTDIDRYTAKTDAQMLSNMATYDSHDRKFPSEDPDGLGRILGPASVGSIEDMHMAATHVVAGAKRLPSPDEDPKL